MSADATDFRRDSIGALISKRLAPEADRMRAEFCTPGRIGSTWIDNLLPPALAGETPSSLRVTHRITPRDTMYRSHRA